MHGALDQRLCDGAASREVLQQVLRDHLCASEACAFCEETLSRRRPVCRSVALARTALYGQRRWCPDVQVPQQRRSVEQLDLFGGAA